MRKSQTGNGKLILGANEIRKLNRDLGRCVTSQPEEILPGSVRGLQNSSVELAVLLRKFEI